MNTDVNFYVNEEIMRLHRLVDQTAKENANLRFEIEQLRYYNRLLSTHKEYDV
jgi:cell division protein FtsL